MLSMARYRRPDHMLLLHAPFHCLKGRPRRSADMARISCLERSGGFVIYTFDIKHQVIAHMRADGELNNEEEDSR